MKFILSKLLSTFTRLIIFVLILICLYQIIFNVGTVIDKTYKLKELAKLIIFLSILMSFFILGIINKIKKIIRKGTILTLTLEGDLAEDMMESFDFIGGSRYKFYQLLMILNYALKDKKISSMLVKIRNLSLGWGRLAEIYQYILKWREEGKDLLCFIGDSTNNGYYLATAASKIHMNKGSVLFFNGLAYEIPFYKKLMDRFGVSFEVEHSGLYKTSFDQFIYDHMQEAQREMIKNVLEHIQGEIVSKVSQYRGIEEEQVIKLMEEGIFTSESAKINKLIDDELSLEQYKQILKEDNKDIPILDIEEYFSLRKKKILGKARNKIGMIYINGIIQEGISGYHPTFGKISGSDDIFELLDRCEEEKELRGVIIRINSPGGSATASEILWHKIKHLTNEKPIVALMGDIAASGGYYIASAANKIIASPLTITGSIGVITGKLNIEELLSKLNINIETIKLSSNADIMSLFTHLTEEQRLTLRKINDEFYRIFIKRVAEGRNLSEKEIEEVSNGKIWIAKDALKYKLIDEISGLKGAIKYIKERNNIKEDEPVQIYELALIKPIWKRLKISKGMMLIDLLKI